MGQLHNELRRGPLGVALANAVGDTRGGGLERYGETLTPVLDLWRRPEWAYLRGENLWAGTTGQTGVALENGFVAIGNPDNSGLIIVVDFIALRVAAANQVLSVGQQTDANVIAFQDASTATVTRDRRNGPPGNFSATPVLRRGGNAGLFGQQAEDVISDANGYVVVKSTPYVLPPGQAVLVEHATVNVTIVGSFSGYVRQAFPGEL